MSVGARKVGQLAPDGARLDLPLVDGLKNREDSEAQDGYRSKHPDSTPVDTADKVADDRVSLREGNACCNTVKDGSKHIDLRLVHHSIRSGVHSPSHGSSHKKPQPSTVPIQPLGSPAVLEQLVLHPQGEKPQRHSQSSAMKLTVCRGVTATGRVRAR